MSQESSTISAIKKSGRIQQTKTDDTVRIVLDNGDSSMFLVCMSFGVVFGVISLVSLASDETGLGLGIGFLAGFCFLGMFLKRIQFVEIKRVESPKAGSYRDNQKPLPPEVIVGRVIFQKTTKTISLQGFQQLKLETHKFRQGDMHEVVAVYQTGEPVVLFSADYKDDAEYLLQELSKELTV